MWGMYAKEKCGLDLETGGGDYELVVTDSRTWPAWWPRGDADACLLPARLRHPAAVQRSAVKPLYDSKSAAQICAENFASDPEDVTHPQNNVFVARKAWVEKNPDEAAFLIALWDRGIQEWAGAPRRDHRGLPRGLRRRARPRRRRSSRTGWTTSSTGSSRPPTSTTSGSTARREVFDLMKETGFIEKDVEEPELHDARADLLIPDDDEGATTTMSNPVIEAPRHGTRDHLAGGRDSRPPGFRAEQAQEARPPGCRLGGHARRLAGGRVLPPVRDAAQSARGRGGDVEIVASGALVSDFAASVVKTFAGFRGRRGVGAPVGYLMGRFNYWKAFFHDGVTVAGIIPALTYAVLSLIIFGLSNLGPILAVALVSAPYVAINVAEGIRGVDQSLVKMSQAFGRSPTRSAGMCSSRRSCRTCSRRFACPSRSPGRSRPSPRSSAARTASASRSATSTSCSTSRRHRLDGSVHRVHAARRATGAPQAGEPDPRVAAGGEGGEMTADPGPPQVGGGDAASRPHWQQRLTSDRAARFTFYLTAFLLWVLLSALFERIPGPSAVVSALVKEFSRGEVFGNFADTFYRFGIGVRAVHRRRHPRRRRDRPVALGPGVLREPGDGGPRPSRRSSGRS